MKRDSFYVIRADEYDGAKDVSDFEYIVIGGGGAILNGYYRSDIEELVRQNHKEFGNDTPL